MYKEILNLPDDYHLIRFDDYERVEGVLFDGTARQAITSEVQPFTGDFLSEYFGLLVNDNLNIEERRYRYQQYTERATGFINQASQHYHWIEDLRGLLEFTFFPPVELCAVEENDQTWTCRLYWVTDPETKFERVLRVFQGNHLKDAPSL